MTGMKKAVDFLTPSEKQIVLDCLHAAADGPFFPDWEISTLIGVSREDVRATAARLNKNIIKADDSWIITNCLNNLSGYPHSEFERWHEHFAFSKEDLLLLLTKLLARNK